MGMLARNGYEFTPRAEEADVLVVNTCSFIAPAQKESIDTILEMAEHKKFGAAKKLIVAGCLVERYRDQILEQIPEVDAVVGTGEIENILGRRRGRVAHSMRRARRSFLRICITILRRAFSRRRNTPRTSRSPKAATIPARFASSRSCAGNSAAGGLNPWCARRKISPRPASAK